MNAPPRPRRRRLTELPPDAQDLLVALTWSPAALRQTLEQVLGRVHANPVQLQGSDADLMDSLGHDLATRNAISDTLHRQLAQRHSVACTRLARLRGVQALRQAWAERPADQTLAATLWALLTHFNGAEIQDWVLGQARQWLYMQARQAEARHRAETESRARLAALQAEADSLRQRLLRQQAQADAALQAAAQALAQARGQYNQEVVYQPAARAHAARPRVASVGADSTAQAGAAKSGSPGAARAGTNAPETPRRVPAARHALSNAPTYAPAAAPQSATSPVKGQRVLCVGGIQHAVARYRSRVESLGGRFEHHDGGLHDNAHVLDGRLARADLVICQAGCINHSAYHRIKQHCQRTGKPCLYLERASLSRFDRALQTLPVVSAQTARPAVAGPV